MKFPPPFFEKFHCPGGRDISTQTTVILEDNVIKEKFVDYDINILYWVSLFHDIGKHQKMHKIYEKDYIYGILDKMHPFKNIILFIEIIFEKNLFKIAEDDIIILKKNLKNLKK